MNLYIQKIGYTKARSELTSVSDFANTPQTISAILDLANFKAKFHPVLSLETRLLNYDSASFLPTKEIIPSVNFNTPKSLVLHENKFLKLTK